MHRIEDMFLQVYQNDTCYLRTDRYDDQFQNIIAYTIWRIDRSGLPVLTGGKRPKTVDSVVGALWLASETRDSKCYPPPSKIGHLRPNIIIIDAKKRIKNHTFVLYRIQIRN